MSEEAGPKSDEGGKRQFNVYLPPELIRRVKHRALDDQVSLSEFVSRALQAALERGGG